ncbi:MAG: dimethylsulfonioproprionate lyase family protein [Pseudomonadota bacterium]
MTPDQIELDDRHLLGAIQRFVAGWQGAEMDPFRADIAQWGETRIEVAPRHLPAAETLARAACHAIDDTRGLLDAMITRRATRHWEQTYSKADGVVSDAMLADYGFAEVIGQRGPFVSDRVRSGIGLYGPNIHYPPHRHAAEEIYLPLAGEALFEMDGVRETRPRGPGDAVFMRSNRVHGFSTGDLPFAVFYIWRAGDLRQKSTFERPAQ